MLQYVEAAFSNHFTFKQRGGNNMNIKYTGNDTNKSENGKIHVKNGNYTGCGARIDDNPEDWVETAQAVTCEKNGCKK